MAGVVAQHPDMARKAAVEHLRSTDNQHYAGSRKLGDQPDTARDRAVTVATDPAVEAFAEFEQATISYNQLSGSDIARMGPAHPNWSTFEPKLTDAYIRGVAAANQWLDTAHPTFDEDAGTVAYTELVGQLTDIATDNTHTADAIADARKMSAPDAVEHLRLHIQMNSWRSTTKTEMIAAAEKLISQRNSQARNLLANGINRWDLTEQLDDLRPVLDGAGAHLFTERIKRITAAAAARVTAERGN